MVGSVTIKTNKQANEPKDQIGLGMKTKTIIHKSVNKRRIKRQRFEYRIGVRGGDCGANINWPLLLLLFMWVFTLMLSDDDDDDLVRLLLLLLSIFLLRICLSDDYLIVENSKKVKIFLDKHGNIVPNRNRFRHF
jgi:hypothetical protein